MIINFINIIKKISEYNYKFKFKGAFNRLDKTVKNIIKIGLKLCFFLGLIALIILTTYNLSFRSPFLFDVGFVLFKLSLIFGVEFIICGFTADKVKSDL